MASLALVGGTTSASGAQSAQAHARPTQTARVVVASTALAAPRSDARPKMRLSGATAWSGIAQRLMVTGRHRDAAGREWVRVQLPIRPNESNGWVPAERLRITRTVIRFEVHLGSRRLEIWRGAQRLGDFPVGIGRPGTPTPVGRFAIQDPFTTLPAWRGVYGRYTLALTAHSPTLRSFMGGDALVAIHGPGSGGLGRVGRESSHGCVILAEPALAIAARFARGGTPVVIDRS